MRIADSQRSAVIRSDKWRTFRSAKCHPWCPLADPLTELATVTERYTRVDVGRSLDTAGDVGRMNCC
jgi:hypothetical protein